MRTLPIRDQITQAGRAPLTTARSAAGGREVLVRTFDELGEALAFALSRFAARRRGYEVAMLGPPARPQARRAASVRVADEDQLFGNGRVGLVVELVLPFDTQPADGASLDRLEVAGFERLPGGVNHLRLAGRFGSDAEQAAAAVRTLIGEPGGVSADGAAMWTVTGRGTVRRARRTPRVPR